MIQLDDGFTLEFQSVVTGYVTAGIASPDGNFVATKEYKPGTPTHLIVEEANNYIRSLQHRIKEST